jgi:hypothetical protein
VRELSLVELLVDAFPERAGSPLSVKNLREDLEVAHDTVNDGSGSSTISTCASGSHRSALRASVPPRRSANSIFGDWSALSGPRARFENLVASHLLKLCHSSSPVYLVFVQPIIRARTTPPHCHQSPFLNSLLPASICAVSRTAALTSSSPT